MGHDETGAAHEQLPQGFLDSHFGQRIDRAGGLVENQYPRVGQHGPCKTDQLPLSQRQPAAALPHRGLEPVGQPFDEVATSQPFGGQDHFDIGRFGTPDPDVVEHRAGE